MGELWVEGAAAGCMGTGFVGGGAGKGVQG